jgi:xylulose-5-phosphate/fructose-6-phosphate phosphoketolase
MVVLNDLDRYHLVLDVIRWVPGLAAKAAAVKQDLERKLKEHRDYVCDRGEDLPEIRNWRWSR